MRKKNGAAPPPGAAPYIIVSKINIAKFITLTMSILKIYLDWAKFPSFVPNSPTQSDIYLNFIV